MNGLGARAVVCERIVAAFQCPHGTSRKALT